MNTRTKKLLTSAMIIGGIGTYYLAQACQNPLVRGNSAPQVQTLGEETSQQTEDPSGMNGNCNTAEEINPETNAAEGTVSADPSSTSESGTCENSNNVAEEIAPEANTNEGHVPFQVSPDTSNEALAPSTCPVANANLAAVKNVERKNENARKHIGKDRRHSSCKSDEAAIHGEDATTPTPASGSSCNGNGETTTTDSDSTTTTPTSGDCKTGNLSEQFLCILNAYRKANGKNALTYNTLLSKAAENHSAWMASSGVFDHIGKDGSNPAQRCEAVGTKCDAENIAYGFTDAQKLFEAWKNSPGHNANMLGDHTQTGLGISGTYVTSNFI